MNTPFSIQRIGLLFRKDWIENKKKLTHTTLAFIGAFLMCLFITYQTADKHFVALPFYCLGLLGSFIGFCRYTNTTIHYSKGIYLTLPASTLEKYLTILIEGLLLLLSYHILFWGMMEFGSLFVQIPQLDNQFVRIEKIDIPIASMNIPKEIKAFSVLTFAASLMFLSYVTFRKYALGITLAGYILIVSSITGFTYLAFTKLSLSKYEFSSALFQAGTWLHQGMTPMFLLATLVVMYIAYLKFKEKESK